MNYWLLLIPFLSACIGWITIRMAVWLLFHPLQPKIILGLKVQGIWPARKEQIALQAGNYAAAAFPIDELEQRFNEPGRFEAIKPLIEEHMDHFLRHKLKEQMPMIAMFIGDKTIQSLKTIFIQEIEALFPQVIGSFAGNLKKELKLHELISTKLAAIPTHSIEQAFRKEMATELRLAGLFGGFIGLIIGLLQLLIVLFL